MEHILIEGLVGAKMFDILIKIWAFFVSLVPHWTVVVDTETTDKYPWSAELLQVSLVSGTGRVLFNKYIKPDSDTEWPEAQKINHISPRMVKHCRDISFYTPVINAYLKHTKRIVGYSLTRFDLQILERYGISTSAEPIDIIIEDANKRTKPGERQAKFRKLTSTARHYGYLFIAHDAVEDCLATLHVYCFMHPGVRTFLYLLRKIVRVIAGALLIGICCGNGTTIENTAVVPNVLPYTAIAAWCYVYGPFTGVLSTLLGVFVFATETIPLIPVVVMSLFLGIFYGIVRSPKPWLIRIIMCIAFTIAGGMIGFILVPELMRSVWQIQIETGNDIESIIVSMIFGIPFYFLMNRFLNRIL